MIVTEIDSFESPTGAQTSYTSPAYDVAAGDIVLVVAATNVNQQPASVEDSVANAFTEYPAAVRGTTIAGSGWLHRYTAAATGVTVTVTWSPAVSERLVKVLKITGGGAAPDTASAGGTAGSAYIASSSIGTASSPGPMTPTNADLVVAFAAWTSATPASAGPSGYTNTGIDLNEATRLRSLSTYYKVQAATGAENPTWTIESQSWIAGQIAIPAAAAPAASAFVPRILQYG